MQDYMWRPQPCGGVKIASCPMPWAQVCSHLPRTFSSSLWQADRHKRPRDHQDIRIEVRVLDDGPTGSRRR